MYVKSKKGYSLENTKNYRNIHIRSLNRKSELSKNEMEEENEELCSKLVCVRG
jgi:hypothetical protein